LRAIWLHPPQGRWSVALLVPATGDPRLHAFGLRS